MSFEQYEPGTYEVKVNKETTTVDVDNFRYGGKDGYDLEAIKDGKIVATFRYYESITLKKAATSETD